MMLNRRMLAILSMLLILSIPVYAEPASPAITKECQWWDIACKLNPLSRGSAMSQKLLSSGSCDSGFQWCSMAPDTCNCFANGWDCGTAYYCNSGCGWWVCGSGNKGCCYNGNNPLCFGNAYDCGTIFNCNSGGYQYWACASGQQGFCVNSNTPWCCQSGYIAKSTSRGIECWLPSWQCIVDADCGGTGKKCEPSTHICTSCTPDKNMNGICYYDTTNFVTCPNCLIKNKDGVLWSGSDTSIDTFLGTKKSLVSSIWHYDGCDWKVWTPSASGTLGNTLKNNYCYGVITTGEVDLRNVPPPTPPDPIESLKQLISNLIISIQDALCKTFGIWC